MKKGKSFSLQRFTSPNSMGRGDARRKLSLWETSRLRCTRGRYGTIPGSYSISFDPFATSTNRGRTRSHGTIPPARCGNSGGKHGARWCEGLNGEAEVAGIAQGKLIATTGNTTVYVCMNTHTSDESLCCSGGTSDLWYPNLAVQRFPSPTIPSAPLVEGVGPVAHPRSIGGTPDA